MLTAQDLTQSVNPMTGVPAFPVTLLALPGRNGFNVAVALRYDGNVRAVAGTWNLEASTSTVGLGFSLDAEYIVADPNRGVATGNTTYFHVSGGSATRLVNTGTSGQKQLFTTQSRQPWQITYDPANERWTVVKEDGVVHQLGGASGQGSIGNSIQWGVRWGGFLGPSAQTTGQVRFALVWNLASVTSPLGDVITYTYSLFADDQIATGTGGLAYTRASYLASITDTLGRVISFQYANKLNDPTGQREFAAPHTGTYNTPNAYQDRYETRYLASVAVVDARQSPLMTVTLGSAVVGAGALAKRYLTSVASSNAAGGSQPGLIFDYYYTATDGSPLGALKSVTLPTGGVFTYALTQASPTLANRTAPILKSGFTKPRVYARGSYVVTTWYDPANKFANAYAYTWNGRWIEDSLGSMGVNDQYDNLQVVTQGELFAIFRPTYTVQSAVKPRLYVDHRNPALPGDHISANFDLSSLSATEAVELAAGDRYVAVLGKSTGLLLVFTWNGASWTAETAVQLPYQGQTPCYSIAGDHNYLAVISRPYSSPTEVAELRLLYVDGQGAWQTGFSGMLTTTAQNADDVSLFAGDSFVVLEVENDQLGPNNYRYQAITWTPDYTAPSVFMLFESGAGQSFTPAIRGGLVGIDTNLFRYDGKDFRATVDLSASAYRYPQQTGGRLLSYGYDKVVRRVEQGNDGGILGYAYDISEYFPALDQFAVNGFNGANRPSLQQTEWGFLPRTSSTIRFPSNYVLLSDKVYYESPDFSWAVVGTIPDDVARSSAGSVQLSGARFLCYQRGADAWVLPLKNGAVLAGIKLAGRSIVPGTASGTQLVGPLGLVSYTGSLDTPASLQVHAVVADGVDGVVSNYVVTSVGIDDGFGSSALAYVYEPASAVADPSGYTNMYNKVTIVNGAGLSGAAPFGSVERYLFNGLPSELLSLPFPTDATYTNASTYYGLFVGLPYTEIGRTAAGAQASLTTSYWMAYPAQLARITPGTRVRQTRSVSLTDGVTSTVTNAHDAGTGLLVQTTTASTSWSGAAEDVITSTLYASQVYAQMAAANLLTQVAQTKRTIGSINAEMTATTWQLWNGTQYAPYRTYRALASTTDFNFALWSGGAEPPANLWLKTSEVRSRGPSGAVLEAVDAEGVVASTVYDVTQYLQVATFTGASILAQEAAWYGFESYEVAAGWQLSGGAARYSGDAHTGATSLQVPASGSGSPTLVLQRSFLPTTQGQAYFFAFWVKTAPGFGADGGTAYVTISFSSSQPAQSVPITDTAGSWVYVCSQAISPSVGSGSPVTVTISAYTRKQSASFLLDDLVFAPAVGAFAASVYSTPNQLVSAKNAANGLTMRYVYDGLQRQVATVGPAESVDDVTLHFQAREGGAGGASPTRPNVVTALGARGGGGYQYFWADWQSSWQATDAASWQVVNGTLLHTGQGSGTATWRKYGGAQNFGVRIEVDPPAGGWPTGKVGLAIGTLQITWLPDGVTPGKGTWSFNGVPITNPRGGSFSFAREWVLASVDGRALFWANGQLLVDTLPSGVFPGNVVLTAETSVGFRDFVTFVEPTIEALCSDGLGKVRQRLTMDGPQTVVVAQTLYDGLARPAIQTKSSTYSVDVSQPLFTYRADYVTNEATIWTTGLMQGTINDLNPADGGYPYSRTVFEASPLGRPVEVGLPGASFAVGANSRRYAYGTNTGGTLPASSYFVTSETNPDGIVTATTVDRAGNVIRKDVSSAGAVVATTTYSYVWSVGARTVTVFPPCSAAPPPPTSAADYAFVEQYNYLGQLVKTSSVTEGSTFAVYSPSGRLRFRMTADGANAGDPSQDVLQYHTYDAAGQPIDDGTTVYDWSLLPAIAMPSYAPPSTLTVRVLRAYFGPGSGNAGRLQTVSTTAAGGTTPNVVKSVTYDAVGNLASVGLVVTDHGAKTYAIAYTYDNFRNPVSITYLDAGTLVVGYTYNRRGLVNTAGQAGQTAFASYLYDANGSIARESLGVWGSQGVQRTYTYNSPGWITTVSYRYLAQTLSYDAGAGYKGATYHSGLVAAEAYSPVWDGAPAGYLNQYAYDALGQLKYSLNNLSTEWGIGIGAGVQYDPNGNLLALNRGNTNLKYAYQTANQVATISGSVSQQLQYTPSGAVRSALPGISSIAYDPLSAMATRLAVTTGSTPALSFAYDDNAQRVYKRVDAGGSTTTTLYVMGSGTQPLIDVVTAGDGAEVVTLHVYTPNGRVAYVRGGATYNVLRDALGSTRVVIDSRGNVVASYDYMPFGRLMRTTGAPATTPYLYTGQELDAFSATPDDGLYNYKARFYDNNSSRFYQPDARGQLGTPYAYVGNNPVSYSDPSGQSWYDVLGVIGAILGAAAAGIAAGLLLPIELPTAVGLLGAYAVGRIAGGTYAIANGVQGTDLIDYANSYGVAAVTAVGGGLLAPAAGLSTVSVVLAEAFGVANAYSLAPQGSNPANFGYYIAAGIAVSFASEALGNTAVRAYAGVGFAGVENAVVNSTAAGVVQKGVAGFTSGALVGGGAAAANGASTGEVLGRGLRGGIIYGGAAALGGGLRGDMAVFRPGGFTFGGSAAAILQRNFAPITSYLVQQAGEKIVKQTTVMVADPAVLWARVNLAKTWLPRLF